MPKPSNTNFTMKESIKVFAPATVANVACGFDILGFAINTPGDEVVLEKRNVKGLEITEITGDSGRLPRALEANTTTVAIQKYLEHIGAEGIGLSVRLHKKMPLGSGMGSSAASAVAGVFAINELMGTPLSRTEILPFAMEGERIACGAAHADNVAPSLLGGFVLVRSYHPLDVVKIDTPESLFCTLIHPQLEVPTQDARRILRKQLSLEDAITQWGNVGGLIAGLQQNDFELIGRSLEDVVAEPVRSLLIPGFREVKEVALANGALGCGISGSGPSIFSLSQSQTAAETVGALQQTIFRNLEIESEVYVSQINQQGPTVLG